ncbi:MAG: hypothetical protein Q9204_008791 [Flavoplaca sp. TL-2023a]
MDFANGKYRINQVRFPENQRHNNCAYNTYRVTDPSDRSVRVFLLVASLTRAPPKYPAKAPPSSPTEIGPPPPPHPPGHPSATAAASAATPLQQHNVQNSAAKAAHPTQPPRFTKVI